MLKKKIYFYFGSLKLYSWNHVADGPSSPRRKLKSESAASEGMKKSKSISSKMAKGGGERGMGDEGGGALRKSQSVVDPPDSPTKSRTLSESQKPLFLDEMMLSKRDSVRRDSKLRDLIKSKKFSTFYELKKAREEIHGFGMEDNQPIFDHLPGNTDFFFP